MGADGKRLGPLAVSLVALAVTGIFTAGALWIGGYAPTSALGSLLAGAFGSLDRFLSVTLVHAVPLTLTGLAVAVAFRAGVWNIGAEGQLYAGAVAGGVGGAPRRAPTRRDRDFDDASGGGGRRDPSGRWFLPS